MKNKPLIFFGKQHQATLTSSLDFGRRIGIFLILLGIALLIHHTYIHEGVVFVASDLIEYGIFCHEFWEILMFLSGLFFLLKASFSS
jgi:hypothetical protein